MSRADTCHFIDTCDRVRFTLDTPEDSRHDQQGLVADFVGWARSVGLLVTSKTVPAVHETIMRVCQVLELEKEPEVYVLNDPSPNAFAPTFATSHRPIVVLNSGLVRLLSTNELAFTLGHELGHLGLGHGSLPHNHGSGPDSEYHALQMRSRQRYAEVSADRVGLIASRSVFTSAHVMIKLASGLPSEFLGIDVNGFIEQITDEDAAVNSDWSLSQSHPSLPLRLWALVRFSTSQEYGSISGQVMHGSALSEIDEEIIQRLDQLGDGRLNELEEQRCQMALLWTATALVMDDDKIEDFEVVELRKLVGEEMSSKALTYARNNGRSAVIQKLEESIYRASSSSETARQRLVHSANAFALAIEVAPRDSQAMQVIEKALRT